MPVYELFGAYCTEIPAYASTVTFSSIAEYLDVADQCLELGYPAIKLHAWGDARRDAALAVALRAHVGDDVDLMYDGSAGFDLPDTIYLGEPSPTPATAGTRNRCGNSALPPTSGWLNGWKSLSLWPRPRTARI